MAHIKAASSIYSVWSVLCAVLDLSLSRDVFCENVGHVYIEDGESNASCTDERIDRDLRVMQICLYGDNGFI